MLKLKLQYFGHLMRRADSFEKTLMLGKIEGRRRGDDRGWDGWMASPIQWTWTWANSRRWWGTGKPGVLQSMRSQRVRHDWATEQQPVVKTPQFPCRGWGFNPWSGKQDPTCLEASQKTNKWQQQMVLGFQDEYNVHSSVSKESAAMQETQVWFLV